jgi:hypothetical protein
LVAIASPAKASPEYVKAVAQAVFENIKSEHRDDVFSGKITVTAVEIGPGPNGMQTREFYVASSPAVS